MRGECLKGSALWVAQGGGGSNSTAELGRKVVENNPRIEMGRGFRGTSTTHQRIAFAQGGDDLEVVEGGHPHASRGAGYVRPALQTCEPVYVKLVCPCNSREIRVLKKPLWGTVLEGVWGMRVLPQEAARMGD